MRETGYRAEIRELPGNTGDLATLRIDVGLSPLDVSVFTGYLLILRLFHSFTTLLEYFAITSLTLFFVT